MNKEGNDESRTPNSTRSRPTRRNLLTALDSQQTGLNFCFPGTSPRGRAVLFTNQSYGENVSSEVLKSISAHVGVFCMCAFVCVCVNALASVSALLKLYLCRCDVSKTFYVICM